MQRCEDVAQPATMKGPWHHGVKIPVSSAAMSPEIYAKAPGAKSTFRSSDSSNATLPRATPSGSSISSKLKVSQLPWYLVISLITNAL